MAKDNCYGLGTQNILPHIDEHVAFYAVKDVAEAVSLRGLTKKTRLCLLPFSCIDNVENDFSLIDFPISFTVQSAEDLLEIERLFGRYNKFISIQVKINSGMNRFGVSEIKTLNALLDNALSKNFTVDGVYTHLCADNQDFVNRQKEKFEELTNSLPYKKHLNFKHLNNLLVYDNTDYIRSGIDVLGVNGYGFYQCFTILSKIIAKRAVKNDDYVGYDFTYRADKDTEIAIVKFGYADMPIFRASKKHYFKVCGVLCKVLAVAMDVTFIDVTKVRADVGESVEVIFGQDGLFNLAKSMGTIPYELLTSFKG